MTIIKYAFFIFTVLLILACISILSQNNLLIKNKYHNIRYISSCMNITSPGYYELNTSIYDNKSTGLYGYCIGIFASNVTLNGNGYSIHKKFEFGEPFLGNGIYIGKTAHNITIENLIVSYYLIGINITDGNNILNNVNASYNSIGIIIGAGNNILNNVNASYNNYYGISIYGSNNILKNVNAYYDEEHGIQITDGSNILNNVNANNEAYGININGSSNILNNVNANNEYALGIYINGSSNILNNVNAERNPSGIFINGSSNILNNVNANRSYISYSIPGVGINIAGNNNKLYNINVSEDYIYGIYIIGNNNSMENVIANEDNYSIYIIGNNNFVKKTNTSYNIIYHSLNSTGIYLKGNGNILKYISASFDNYGINIYGHDDFLENVNESCDLNYGIYIFGNNNFVKNANINNCTSYYFNISSNNNRGNIFLGYANINGLNTSLYSVKSLMLINGMPIFTSVLVHNMTNNSNRLILIKLVKNFNFMIYLRNKAIINFYSIYSFLDPSFIKYINNYNFYGIEIVGDNNKIYNVNVSKENYGIEIVGDNNSLEDSFFINNKNGLYLNDSYEDLIYNNVFNNINNVYINNSWAYWNTSLMPDKNILNGNLIGGNAWLSPNGNGFSQTCKPRVIEPDICSKPYSLEGNNTDYLPLAYPQRVKYAIANITFVEVGLPSNASWSVTLYKITKSSNLSKITFLIPIGNYTYTISNVTGYIASPFSGNITLNKNMSITIKFVKIPSTTSPIYSKRTVSSFLNILIYTTIGVIIVAIILTGFVFLKKNKKDL